MRRAAASGAAYVASGSAVTALTTVTEPRTRRLRLPLTLSGLGAGEPYAGSGLIRALRHSAGPPEAASDSGSE